MAAHFVTGGAGFIGSHLVDTLAAGGEHSVVVYDNLSNSTGEWLRGHLDSSRVRLVVGDILDLSTLTRHMAGAEIVVHLASSVDLRRGIADRAHDLQQCATGTLNVLQAMRANGVREMVFASSSTVFGDPPSVPTDECVGPMLPLSLYGAGKMAAEGLVSAFTHLDGLHTSIFRFGNVVGGRMNHGVVYDFITKLRQDPGRLEVLGNGRQEKTYFLVEDCVRGMLSLHPLLTGGCNVVNLANEGTVSVDRIAEIVIEMMGCRGTRVEYSGGQRGWPGDVPLVHLDVRKAWSLGWRASANGEESIRECARRLLADWER